MPEIIRQAEEYGLPTPESAPLPSAEKVADLLTPPTPWAGPIKRAEHLEVPPAPGRPPTPSADPATAMGEPRPASGAGAGL